MYTLYHNLIYCTLFCFSRRLREVGKTEEGMWSIGNDVFSVTLSPELDLECLPLFGAKYNFKLHKVVDLPEFLVHFHLLIT